MIEVKDLTKRFGMTLAVDHLTFSAAKGEILGFLGPNGAGKTTTLRILTGFFPPTSGAAFIGGRDVVDQPLEARRSVGYLPENVPLYVDMRVGEYLGYVAGLKGLPKARRKGEVQRVMEAVGITDRRGQLIKQLSKGYRQRVGLAQALLGDPPVLILDEPTIGLDPGQIRGIRELIRSMAGNKTVILSSHILPEVEATCSRVVIINKGRMVAEGPPSILSSGAAGGKVRLAMSGDLDRLRAACLAIPGVGALIPQMEGTMSGAGLFLAETDGEPGTRAEIARTVIREGGELFELSLQTASLEEVYVQLTTSEDARTEGREEAA